MHITLLMVGLLLNSVKVEGRETNEASSIISPRYQRQRDNDTSYQSFQVNTVKMSHEDSSYIEERRKTEFIPIVAPIGMFTIFFSLFFGINSCRLCCKKRYKKG